MSETTTETPEVDGGQEPQPEAPATVEAVEKQPAESEVAETTEEAPAQEAQEPSEDDNSKWLKSKGIDPNDPDAINKLAKISQDAEKFGHSKAQKASELEKTMGEMSDASAEHAAEQTGQDPEVLKRLQRMEVKEAKRDFFQANPDAAQYESQMAKIAVESGLYGSPEAILNAAYAIAKNQDSSVKSQVKAETLKGLAQKQQSAVPKGNAVTSGTTPKEKPVSEMTIAEIEAKYGFAKR